MSTGLEGVLEFLERHPDAIDDIDRALARAAAHAHEEASDHLLAEDHKWAALTAECAGYRGLREKLQEAWAS